MIANTPARRLAHINAYVAGATTPGELAAALNAKANCLNRYFVEDSHDLLNATTPQELAAALRGCWDFNGNTLAMDSTLLTAYLTRVDATLLAATLRHMTAIHSSWHTNGTYTGPMVPSKYNTTISMLKFHNCITWPLEMAVKRSN